MSASPFLPLTDIVDVVVQVSPQLPAAPTFSVGLIMGISGRIPTSGANSRIVQFSSLSAMLSYGFLVTDPEYIAAAIYFGQLQPPTSVCIGARSPSGLNLVVPHTGSIGTGYLVGDIITVTQAGGSLGTVSVATIGGGGTVTGLTLATSGQGYAVATALSTTGGTGTGLEVDISTVGEPLLQGIIACRAASSVWYAVMGTTVTDADILAVALWAQAAQPVVTFFYSTADANVLNNVGGNIAAVLLGAAYSRTIGVYSTTQGGVFPNNIYAAAAAMGNAMGLNSGLPNSFFTLMFKQMVGISSEPLTQAQVNTLTSLNMNINLNYGNSFTFFQKGQMSNGQRFWQIINIDMLTASIQFNIMDQFVSLPAIPQTDPGETFLIHAVNQAAAQAALIGFIGPGVWEGVQILSLTPGTALPSGYYAQAPSYATQSATNRIARQAMPIYLAIIEAGAAESILIGVYVQQ